MVKRFIMLLVLLAGTALTVLLGEGFDFLDPDPTAAATHTSTLVVEATATTAFNETAVPTATAEYTSTPASTSTPDITATATAIPTNTATATPTATNTSTPIPTLPAVNDPFKIQPGSPVYTVNFVHLEAGCNWEGVAGQVLSSDGSPLTGYILKVSGTYSGAAVNQIGLSGLVTNEPYGPGSFEFVLGTTAVDSENKLTIQLFSPAGVEMISPVSFNTFAACSKNLMIINFQQK